MAAEAAGFDAITFPDSICYPKECDSTYPYNDDGSREFLDGVPFLEPFSIIPAIAAVTEKLEFSTSVYKLAPRQAVTTAKFVTTLGVMTNNRFHFGVTGAIAFVRPELYGPSINSTPSCEINLSAS